MAVFNSKLSVFKITDTAASSRDISAYIKSIDGLPGPHNLNDASPIGASGKAWQVGLEDVTFSLELMFSNEASTGADTVLGPLSRHTAATAFEYAPIGTANPNRKISGNCWVKNYQIITKVGEIIMAKVELQVDGVVTVGTY